MSSPLEEIRLPRNLAELACLIACEIRLEVLSEVVRSRTSVTSIADRTQLDIPSVSNHLRVLRIAGAVLCAKERQKHFYTPGPIVSYRGDAGVLAITLRARDGNELSVRIAGELCLQLPISVQGVADGGAGGRSLAMRR